MCSHEIWTRVKVEATPPVQPWRCFPFYAKKPKLQEAFEKMLDIISNWGNANKTHKETPSHTHTPRMVFDIKDR